MCEPSPGVGEPCPTIACARGAYCVDGVCVAGASTGFCEVGYECLTSSHCDFETHECVPSRPNGDSCADPVECESEYRPEYRCRDWTLANFETCAGREIAGVY